MLWTPHCSCLCCQWYHLVARPSLIHLVQLVYYDSPISSSSSHLCRCLNFIWYWLLVGQPLARLVLLEGWHSEGWDISWVEMIAIELGLCCVISASFHITLTLFFVQTTKEWWGLSRQACPIIQNRTPSFVTSSSCSKSFHCGFLLFGSPQQKI
jgi:hypothetical protein